MFVVEFWLKKKADWSEAEFREYWLTKHAPLARDGFTKLRGYKVNAVRRVAQGEAAYDGTAELWWDSKEDFAADSGSDAGKQGVADLDNFTDAWTLVLVDQTVVK